MWAFVSPYAGYLAPNEPVDRLWKALTDMDRRLERGARRPGPSSGFHWWELATADWHTAAERSLLNRLERHRSEPLRADLALILSDPRDFAAVQTRREFGDWPELDDALRSTADELGRLAADKELSLFLGAGVSRPAGLPGWAELLELLAHEAGMECPPLADGFEKAATPIKEKLGADYVPAMQKLVDAREHAVGHALLAGCR